MNEDRQLAEALDRLSGTVDRSGVWTEIEARAAARSGSSKQASARGRHSDWRVPIYACVAVVLVAAVVIGSFVAVRSLSRPDFVLAITDETVMKPGGTGQTGVTAGQWERLPLMIEGGTIHSVAVSGDDAGSLYAGTDYGLFRSTNGAKTWEKIPEVSGRIFVVFTDPASRSTVYVKFYDDHEAPRLMRSDDSGGTWVDLSGNVSLEPADIGGYNNDLVVFDTATKPSTIYTFVGGRMCRSADKGETWIPLTQVEENKVWDGEIGPSGSLTAAEQARDTFLESFTGTLTDAETGASVRVNNAPAPSCHVHADPSQPSVFYAATYDGVYKSVDAGITWRKASKGLPATEILTLVPDPTSAPVLYATTTAGIFRSTDAGQTWQMILSGEGSLVVAPSSPSTLYAWTLDGLFRSDNAGEDWTDLPAAGLPPRPSRWGFELEGLLLVAPQDPETVFAVSPLSTLPIDDEDGRYVFRTRDGGRNWTQVLEYGGGLVADPSHPSVLYAPEGQDWCRSSDLGSTWTVLSREDWIDPIENIVVDPRGPSSTINIIQKSDAGTYGVSRSLDGGVTWQKVRLEGVARYLDDLAFDPYEAGALYVLAQEPTTTGEKTGIYRSTDDGHSWEDVTGALTDTWVMRIVPDPAPGGALYAVAQTGIFRWVEPVGGTG